MVSLKLHIIIRFFILFAFFSIVFTQSGTSLSNDQNGTNIIIILDTDDSRYIAGESINFSITVKNQNEWPIDISILEYNIIYTTLNMPVLKGNMIWERTILPDEIYSSSKPFLLPDYAPPGEYRINAQLISVAGESLESGSLDIIVKTNYAGMFKAITIFFVYVFLVLSLFRFIYYNSYSEGGKV